MIEALCYLAGVTLLAYIVRKFNSADTSDDPMKNNHKFADFLEDNEGSDDGGDGDSD
ncbi:hypothetical protein [Bacillus sp. OTU530]|jgi:hypothetical protein|uniref:hypothetical protein n=1 Tax=Bacillus sp. OTU530 TaxID=3043862 RepID=UPI00313C113F